MTELSREAILAMVPGRELDELVMTKVFKARRAYHGEEALWYHYDENGEPDYEWNFCNSPSTNIAAAWEIVEILKPTHHFILSWDVQIGNQMALFQTLKEDCPYEVFDYVGDSMPENICKAALLTTLEESK